MTNDASKKAISFSLSSSASATRRPGIKAGSAQLVMGEAQTAEATLSTKGPLVIPLLSRQDASSRDTVQPGSKRPKLASTTETRRQESAAPTSPSTLQRPSEQPAALFGLQVRRPKEEILKAAASERSVIPREVMVERARFLERNGLQQELESLPLATELDAYERIPPSEFGAAMLRGMGWREGESVGRNPSLPLPRIAEPKKREWGLGLGAQPGLKSDSPSSRSRSRSGTATPPSQEGKGGGWGVGSAVAIVSGEHAGLAGRIHEMSSAMLCIRLSVSEELVSVKREHIRLLNDDDDMDADGSLDPSEESSECTGPSWLFPHIQVRIVSKRLAGGALYMKTGEIVDIVTEEDGSCRAFLRLHESERRLSNIYQGQLRPIPPAIGAVGLILEGAGAGDKARVLQMDDRTKENCLVQSLSSGEIFSLPKGKIAACALP